MIDRREFLSTAAAALGANSVGLRLCRTGIWLGAARTTPSPAQLAWQRDELALFCHFGVNGMTYNNAVVEENLGSRHWCRNGAEQIPPIRRATVNRVILHTLEKQRGVDVARGNAD